MENLTQKFKFLISNRNNSSYKYVLALSFLFCFRKGKKKYSFEEIMRFVIPFYFNMTRYKITEKSSGKPPKVLQNISDYSEKKHLRYLCEDDFKYLLKQNEKLFFACPLNCFNNTALSSFEGRNEFFSYSMKEKYIVLSEKFFSLLSERHARELLKDTVFLSLLKFLEKYNSIPNLYTKLSGSLCKKDLKKYKELFTDEKSPLFSDACGICGEKIGKNLSIDHFIPFNYVACDEIWNLIAVHKFCNSYKNDRLGDERTYKKLCKRNKKLYEITEDNPYFNFLKQELFDKFPTYQSLKKEMDDIYASCRSVGYREFSFRIQK